LIHVLLERSHLAVFVAQLVSNLIDSNRRQLDVAVGSQGVLDVRDSDGFISPVQLGLYGVVPLSLGSDFLVGFMMEVLQVVGVLEVGDDYLESL
jgi:hypothetical protein